MKRLIFAAIAAAALLAVLAGTGVRALAQATETPTPQPFPSDPHIYTDPGMDFTAPPEAYLLGRMFVPPAQLGDDLQTVAAWIINPGKEDSRSLVIEMESFSGPPNEWEGQFESQMHGQQDGVLIKNHTPMSLTNGMPAQFVEVTYGSGFDAKKMYAVVFGDGTRGVVLAEIGRIGEITQQEAQRVLKQAKAVRYPPPDSP